MLVLIGVGLLSYRTMTNLVSTESWVSHTHEVIATLETGLAILTDAETQQRGDVTADLSMSVGGIEETVTVEAPPVKVQFNTSSSDITLERRLIDQVPIAGRNPYNLASLDPTITAKRFGTISTSSTNLRAAILDSPYNSQDPAFLRTLPTAMRRISAYVCERSPSHEWAAPSRHP